jgi:pyridoxine 4-dehydrogenase
MAILSSFSPTHVPDEQAFAAIKAGVDTLPNGVKMVLNSGKYCVVSDGAGAFIRATV